MEIRYICERFSIYITDALIEREEILRLPVKDEWNLFEWKFLKEREATFQVLISVLTNARPQLFCAESFGCRFCTLNLTFFFFSFFLVMLQVCFP